MEELRAPFLPTDLLEPASSHNTANCDSNGPRNSLFQGVGLPNLKKRGHGSRSWIRIDRNGNSMVLELDKATLMRRCSLPARDLRLLDPLFIYPSSILGREKAIVYESELCKRLQTSKGQTDNLPFEFRALELALELACMSLDAQVTELEMEIYPVLDELASSINTLNLEHVRRLKGQLLALTRRVQKVCSEIEHLMNDDGDMAEMYLTEKKERMEAYSSSDRYFQCNSSSRVGMMPKSAPISPVGSISGAYKLQRALSTVLSSSKHGSLMGSSNNGQNIEELEMLLEAYFVVIDNTLSNLLSLKEYIDDTEDLINIKLGNVQNQLIQFELLLTAATFVATIFAVVTGIFGMNFPAKILDYPSAFNWVLIITGVTCGVIYFSFMLYFRYKRVLPF